MNHQNKSTPKMRRSYTPRVKSAQQIDEIGQQKALYFTNKKNIPKNQVNPEKIQQHLQKKLNIGAHIPTSHKKINIGLLKTDTDSPVKMNNFFIKNPQINNEKLLKPKQKISEIGRNIQWQANKKANYNLNNKKSNSIEKYSPEQAQKTKNQNYKLIKNSQIISLNQRCMSAQSLRTSNVLSRTSRTNKIKNEKKQFQQKFNVAFNYLLRSNSDYLAEHKSMCNQKARPKQEIFKVKRPMINTTNNDQLRNTKDIYPLEIEPQNQKMSILMSQSKICGNSTTQEFHSGIQQKIQGKATWLQGFKLQGPIYNATTSHNAFPNHGQFQKMVPIAVWNQHPLGMRHKESSTNSKFFKGEYCPRSKLATWNNLNPFANDFSPNKGTIYGDQFSYKQKQPIQNWPLAQHKLITTSIRYDTQNGQNINNFTNHQLNIENKCNCGRKRH